LRERERERQRDRERETDRQTDRQRERAKRGRERARRGKENTPDRGRAGVEQVVNDANKARSLRDVRAADLCVIEVCCVRSNSVMSCKCAFVVRKQHKTPR
jgi:hypothetical protein